MSIQELKWAQKSLHNGGKQIADAEELNTRKIMRSYGTL